MRKFKTHHSKRGNYNYYFESTRTVVTIKPDPQKGVTPAHIAELHRQDDEEFDENRLYESKIERFLEKFDKKGELILDDAQPFLADYRANPEFLYFAKLSHSEREHKYKILQEAWKSLSDIERNIFRLYALEDMSYAAIGRICGCSRQAITQRIETITKRLQKFF